MKVTNIGKKKSSRTLYLAAIVFMVVFGIWRLEIFIGIIVAISLLVCGIFPLTCRYSVALRKQLLFLDRVKRPKNADFGKPETLGVEACRNFYLNTQERMKIGIWQLLPSSLMNEADYMTDENFDAALRHAKRPVFVYMHGNSGSRAVRHRIELYKLLQRLDFHVITFDYRGYGDSDPVDLSEAGVVADGIFVVKWVMEKVKNSSPIFVWGHSLGTGVSVHALAQIAANNEHPSGLILESPFNRLADEIREHPICWIVKHMPWFHWSFIEPFYRNNLRFESDEHIKNIKCPVMIIHAEDDVVIPFKLGAKLFEAGLRSRVNVNSGIEMRRIDGKYGYGHRYICRYDGLPEIIETFISRSLQQTLQ